MILHPIHQLNQNAKGLQLANDGMLYTDGKAVKMFAPFEREIEDAQAVVFQIKAADSFRTDISDMKLKSKKIRRS